MSEMIKHIAILGGGTAGWLTAGIIASRHQARLRKGSLRITLYESDKIPTIGVGEGTWPTMRQTLQTLGISESKFLTECDASFKQGSKFINWRFDQHPHSYHHPFSVPAGYQHQLNMAEHWLSQHQHTASFSRCYSPQEAVCEAFLAPKTMQQGEQQSLLNYGYHLDAGKFTQLLQTHCTEALQVEHQQCEVSGVQLDDDGAIAKLHTTTGDSLTADLYIDCTGLKATLLGTALGIPFKPLNSVLFCDRALATRQAYPEHSTAIASCTLSTAQQAGWIWDIGLQSRRGIGYVYSSQHATEDQALQTLAAYTQSSSDLLEVKSIAFTPGHREKFWHKNCIAIGLSAGFVEPLEASALLMVELSAQFIAEKLPQTYSQIAPLSNIFNERFLYRWGRLVDFLKLHYILSDRQQDAFWRDNKVSNSIPDSLTELLQLWQHTPPWPHDFDRTGEIFQALSYQYVLYGMGFETKMPIPPEKAKQQLADTALRKNIEASRQLTQQLSSNREYLNHLRV
ncbi:tryptophan halogenase family protein [Gilvimarinus polysaccharolyticus]|uniref:tryptophan halogenase family protein n=1 Tax=Gilvimarinus polysaccharolyticus TaxID=863921 RepID=UPI000673AF79|nr:tryptophan halogenase family protein [Gilvimarinus polysaccharolyticus]